MPRKQDQQRWLGAYKDCYRCGNMIVFVRTAAEGSAAAETSERLPVPFWTTPPQLWRSSATDLSGFQQWNRWKCLTELSPHTIAVCLETDSFQAPIKISLFPRASELSLVPNYCSGVLVSDLLGVLYIWYNVLLSIVCGSAVANHYGSQWLKGATFKQSFKPTIFFPSNRER